MSLRMRILLFLFLFGLVPLILAVVINLPLVLERVDLFYRHAFLQNLRADFADLDQHLASRDASVRLLARLPEPGALVADGGTLDQAEIDLARARYTQWVNRILGEFERFVTAPEVFERRRQYPADLMSEVGTTTPETNHSVVLRVACQKRLRKGPPRFHEMIARRDQDMPQLWASDHLALPSPLTFLAPDLIGSLVLPN